MWQSRILRNASEITFLILTGLLFILPLTTLSNNELVTNKRSQQNAPPIFQKKLQEYLEKSKNDLNTIRASLKKTYQNIYEKKMLLKNFQSKEETYFKKLKEQRFLFNNQVRMAYMFGRQPLLKILLNQENSNKMNRMLMYYQYINQNRAKTITDIKLTLNAIHRNQQQMSYEYNDLRKLQLKLRRQEKQCRATQKRQRHLMILLYKQRHPKNLINRKET